MIATAVCLARTGRPGDNQVLACTGERSPTTLLAFKSSSSGRPNVEYVLLSVMVGRLGVLYSTVFGI